MFFFWECLKHAFQRHNVVPIATHSVMGPFCPCHCLYWGTMTRSIMSGGILSGGIMPGGIMSGIQCLDVRFAIEMLRFGLMVIPLSCNQSGQLAHTLASVTILVIYACSFVVASARWPLIYFLFRISVCCRILLRLQMLWLSDHAAWYLVVGFMKLLTQKTIFQASGISLDLTNNSNSTNNNKILKYTIVDKV